MTRPRHFRIIWEATTTKPWVVQYSTNNTHTWTDAYRFDQPERAINYAEEVAARDRALLEAEG